MKQGAPIFAQLVEIIARYAKAGPEYATEIDGLYFGAGVSPTHPVRTTQWPCLALVVQGEKTVTLGDAVYRYGVGDYLVVSFDLPVVSRVTRASPEIPYYGLGMAINPQRLREVMGRTENARPLLPGGDVLGVAVNTAGEDLLQAILRLLRLLETPGHISALAPLIEQEILYRLLQGPVGPRLRQIAISETPSNRVLKAIAWLKDNFSRPLRVEDLADNVGMSVSSLHHHFKAVTVMTPVQYQKHLRLHEARRLMLFERLDVGSAGFSVGYQSPSQFSREYSRLYGISPSRDAAGAGSARSRT